MTLGHSGINISDRGERHTPPLTLTAPSVRSARLAFAFENPCGCSALSDHPSVAKAIADYGRLRLDQGKNDEAAPLFKRALRVQEKALGPEHAAE